MKQLQDSSFSSVEEKSFDENSSQELSLESLSEISGAAAREKWLFGVGGNMGWYKMGGWKKSDGGMGLIEL